MNRKKFWRRAVCTVCAAWLCLGGAACGGDEKPIGGDGEPVGNINISMPITPGQRGVLQAVIDAYNALHPLVNVGITNIDMDSYKNYMETQLASTDMKDVSFDIVVNNTVEQFFTPEKFVDYSQYLSDENPYYDNLPWKDTMDELAYQPSGANGEIYNLNFETTQVRFFYNKEMIAEAGVDVSEFSTWEGFLNACEKIQASTKKPPLALAGDINSFYELQMSWLIRAYTDQYFRSAADTVHAVKGDWNFDPRIDAEWEYRPYRSDWPEIEDDGEAWERAYNNDSFTVYTRNELRLLDAIKKDTLGPINKKYQNMLANLLDLKKYALSGFTGNSYAVVYGDFFNQNSAIILSTLDFFNEVRKRPNFPEVGTFALPPMSANTQFEELADYGPDVDYMRSVGGAIGYYGIVNKGPEQTNLVLDFMKFWTSLAGQEAAMAKRVQLNEYVQGIPLIRGLTVPDSINPAKGLTMKGSADYNPASLFARGLATEAVSTEAFTRNITSLFNAANPAYSDIEAYGKKMQGDMKSNMFRYFAQRGYVSDCLDDVTANPF